MAVELFMTVESGGGALLPADDQDRATLTDLLQVGGVFKVTLTQPRKIGFHRKGMGMFRFLFNLWEPARTEVADAPVSKDFDTFREKLTISAGFYRQVFDLQGGFELKAESLNWSSMDNIRFSEVYNRVIDVGLDMLGKADHMSRDEVDTAINNLLRFG